VLSVAISIRSSGDLLKSHFFKKLDRAHWGRNGRGSRRGLAIYRRRSPRLSTILSALSMLSDPPIWLGGYFLERLEESTDEE